MDRIVDRLLSRTLAKIRAVNDEIFVKEFQFEKEKADRFHRAVDDAVRHATDALEVIFGDGEIPEPVCQAAENWITAISQFERTLRLVLNSADANDELGTRFEAQGVQCRKLVGRMEKAAETIVLFVRKELTL